MIYFLFMGGGGDYIIYILYIYLPSFFQRHKWMLFMFLLFFGLLLMIFFFLGGRGGGSKFYQSFHHHPPSEWKKYWDRYLALTWLILLITNYFSFEIYFSDHYDIHVFNFSSFDIMIRWFGPVRVDSSLEGEFYARHMFWEKSQTQANFPQI